MNKSQELKHYVHLARARGLQVPNGINGGGWIKLASACGIITENKGVARRHLYAFFTSTYPITQQTSALLPVPSNKKLVDPNGKDFLQSYEWRKLRLQALKLYGRRCGCCGAEPNSDNTVRIHVDHIKPRKHFPELALDITNLQILCEDCNHGKGNWDKTDWRTPEQKSDVAPRIRLRVVK